mgnify:CR=1 FL=1
MTDIKFVSVVYKNKREKISSAPTLVYVHAVAVDQLWVFSVERWLFSTGKLKKRNSLFMHIVLFAWWQFSFFLWNHNSDGKQLDLESKHSLFMVASSYQHGWSSADYVIPVMQITDDHAYLHLSNPVHIKLKILSSLQRFPAFDGSLRVFCFV